MKTLDLTPVSINELITISNYSIEETTVPPYSEIERDFSDTWKDLYLDEVLKEQEGKHCYIVHDDLDNSIRAIVVADSLTDEAKVKLIDIMDNVLFDLLYNDMVEQCTENNVDVAYGLGFEQDYVELLKYVDEQEVMPISEWEYTWLQVLANGRLDLVIL